MFVEKTAGGKSGVPGTDDDRREVFDDESVART
jgi:hypothetical protein